MQETLARGVVLAFLLALGLPLARAERPKPAALELPITVYVFNSASVPPRHLIRAETLAASILAKVGIKVIWVAGLTARRADDPPVVEKWNPSNLLLRIRESSTVRGRGINPAAVGFCLSMEKNEAVVLFDAVQNRAASLNVDPAIPLGVTMTHEMGHLLLQSVPHSLAGVMKARWLAEDLTAAEGGTLAFTREEGNSMRNQLLKLKDTDPLGSNVGLAARTNTHQNQANMPARD